MHNATELTTSNVVVEQHHYAAATVKQSLALLVFASAMLLASEAHGSETVTYSYDAKGRLTQAAHSGSANNGLASGYGYDAADNRTQHAVNGANAAARPDPVPFAVVPLNGLQVIAIPPVL